MSRRFWAHAGQFVLGFAMLGSGCSLAEGLSRLQEVDCVGLCPPDASEAAAADGGLDAASMPDATTGPIDAPGEEGTPSPASATAGARDRMRAPTRTTGAMAGCRFSTSGASPTA